MTAPRTAEAPQTTATEPLHQPRRALVALAELLAAAAAVWTAFWCWPRGMVTITTVLENGAVEESTRFFGSWLAGAVGFGTLATLLVLDAVRQTVLAVRTGPRRRRKTDRSVG